MKRFLSAVLLVVIAIMSVGASACSRSDGGLNSTYWRLTGLGAQGSVTPVLAGTAVTLNFNSDGNRVSGSGGCNDYFGDCLVKSDSLTVANLGATKKACADPPGIMIQESAYFELLGKAERFELKGDNLTLNCASNQRLVFERVKNLTNASGLSGTSWKLESYGPASNQKSLLSTTSITLVFDPTAAHVSGNASVNSYGGDCLVAGGKITIANLYQTEMARLDPPGIMQQENDYLTLLAKSERFSADCCGLTIYCTGGDLHFVSG